MGFYDVIMKYFNQMLEYRQSAGFATTTYRYTIQPFIKYSAANHPDALSITKCMVDEWLEHYDFHTNNTQAVFIAMLRRFSSFINAQGGNAYIPDEDYSVNREQYHPYIFNDTEFLTFFNAVDSYQPYYGYREKFKADIILPVLFRMMYCCGMQQSAMSFWKMISMKQSSLQRIISTAKNSN